MPDELLDSGDASKSQILATDADGNEASSESCLFVPYVDGIGGPSGRRL
ncbi:MAG: hypothetical protein AAF481_12285 [Acidobacteriota bacterium]